MKDEKASKAESLEGKAEATGDLEVTTKELANAQETLATARSTCMKVGADHEMTVNARAAELKVIAEAKKDFGGDYFWGSGTDILPLANGCTFSSAHRCRSCTGRGGNSGKAACSPAPFSCVG